MSSNDVTQIEFNSIVKLKRGSEARWNELNPVLAVGEPGFVTDTNKLKIGNGTSAWNELPYIAGEYIPEQGRGILVVDELPEEGSNDLIYKVNSTQKLYIWNSLIDEFQELGQGGSSEPTEGYYITLQNASESRIFVVL
jgi:hypothetical protein